MRIAAFVALCLALAACQCGGTSPQDGGAGGGSSSEDAGTDDGGSDDAGAGGGSGGGGGAGGGGSSCSASVSDGGLNPLLPRLMIEGTAGIHIWNNANLISLAFVADELVPGGGTPVVSGMRLFGQSTQDLLFWNDPENLVETSAATRIPLVTLTNGNGVRTMSPGVNALGTRDLYLAAGTAVVRLRDTDCLTAASRRDARFSDSTGRIAVAAYGQAADLLFATPGPDAGIVVWADAGTRTGNVTSASYVLADFKASQLVAADDRLFAHAGTSEVLIWNNLSGLSGPRPPDVVLDAGIGIGSLRHLALNHGILVLVFPGQVSLYANVGQLAPSTPPSKVVTDAVLGSGAKQAVLGVDGTLYVSHANNIAIFSNADTAATLRVDLQIPTPGQMLLVE